MHQPHRHATAARRRLPIVASPLLSLLLVLLISGCGVIGAGPTSGGGEQHLRLAGSAFGVSTLDPALVRDVESAFLARQVFRGLMKLDESLEPVPELASRVEISPDGLRYTFTIHDSATFHDGSPIDAAAVVSSFNRASDPALAGGAGRTLSAATYFADIEGIDERLDGTADTISGISVIGDNAVEFRLKQPVVSFLAKLTGSPALIVDVKSASSPDWWQTANGSGPFRIAELGSGSRLELEAFEHFIGGGPRLERVSILFGQDASQPMNLYEAGRIDVTEVPSWSLDRVLTPSDPLHPHLVASELLSTTFLAMNPTVAPYDDPILRRAIVSAFDVERLIELALDGRVIRADGLIPPGIGGREWPAQSIAHDLDSARRALDEVGTPDPAPSIIEPGAGLSSVLANVIERDLGLSLAVVDQPWPEFAERLDDADLPALILTWVADYPDPENTLATLLRSGSPDNFAGYSSPEFDDLVERAATETDAAARDQLYLQAQQIAIDDAVIVPLYHGMSYTLVHPRVRGLQITEIGILGLEDVWIED